jgi:hypothetical protein
MFLLDQSGSMDEEFGKEKGVTKAQGAMRARSLVHSVNSSFNHR